MVRINLLPVEILERRRWERWYPWVFLAGGVMLAVLLATWGFFQFLNAQANAELQQTKENVTKYQAQAEALKVFELKEAELKQRSDIAKSARQGAVEMGVTAEEVSLVLPEEVWAERLFIDELAGLELKGFTPDSNVTTIREGYKSIAALLVRLNSLKRLSDVWLTSASSAPYRFGETEGEIPSVQFDVKSKVSTAAPEPDSPAPPSSASGQ